MVPAVVIVDSRNVHGQVGEVLGRPRLPEVQGVIDALCPYGFDVIEVYVGIGIVDRPRARSQLSPAMAAAQRMNAEYAARVAAHPLGHVLAGRLVERAGVREEKLVDVLCAVQVIRAAHAIKYAGGSGQAIVVISMDIDISPAYGFADHELGVPVYAMAANVVHTRPGRWLLGTEDTFATMVGIKDLSLCQPLVGSRLRDALAAMLSHDQPNAERWRALHLERRGTGPKLVVLRHVKTGLLGVAPASMLKGWQKGDRFDLAAVDADVPSPWRFPRAVLAPAGSASSRELGVAQVERWIDSTLARVRTSVGVHVVNVSPGAVVPGEHVLIRTHGGRRTGFVGVIQRRARRPRYALGCRTHVVELTGTTKLGGAEGVTEDGLRVVLRLPDGDAPTPGNRYAGVIANVLRGGQPLLFAVSSALPSSSRGVGVK